MGRLDKSELIFKIIAYTLTTMFAICCVYPLIYAVSGALSGIDALNNGKVILFPVDTNMAAFDHVFRDTGFWTAYLYTIFLTLYGTIYSMFVSITGAYALSKDKLIGKRTWNFLLVFTMWFSAGMIPQFLNYKALNVDNRWGIVICLGMNAFNMILLRNYFSTIPKEIEEAAIVDGANEFQILTKIYMPMSKSSIATVTLFYALSRWNGYFWAKLLLEKPGEWPLQVYMRNQYDNLNSGDAIGGYHPDAALYAMIVCSILPIICVYPMLQKYFAKGVNVGGVKE